MSKPLVLVTGATGKTGAPVVEQLLARGYPVRALARRHDERSEALTRAGAEVALGDYEDQAAIRGALQGVKRVYFAYPPQGDRLVEATAILAAAAREAGVEALVNMSQVVARRDAPSPLSRHHWLSEAVFDWAGIGAIHIRPTFFAENLDMFTSDTIRQAGKLYLPYGDQRHAPVAAEDIARVVVELLDHPAEHIGQRYVLTGPRSLSLAEIAGVFSAELGRDVEYVDLPTEQWGQVLSERSDTTPFLVKHLRTVAEQHKRGVFDVQTDTVEQITGQPAQSLETYIERNRAAFDAETSVGASA